MKKFITIYGVLSLIYIAVVYASAAFYLLESNPALWSTETRGTFLFSLLSGLFLLIPTSQLIRLED